MITEKIHIDGQLCAVIISVSKPVEASEFYTDPELILQVGQIALNSKESILRHRHNLVERRTFGTNEVLIVLEGSLEMELFGTHDVAQEKRTLFKGQVVILCGGGHAFNSENDCVILEIKNGPFMFENDKEYF
jgi:hypothetical protein